MKQLRFLLPLLLLLTIAAPVAAEEQPTPSDAPVPMLYAAPDPSAVTTPCAPEIVDAIAAGTGPGVVVESCLLPDGSILPINVMTMTGGLPGDNLDPSLLPCPEGIEAPDASISSDTVLPCLLADGSLFPAVMPVTINDNMSGAEPVLTSAEAADDASADDQALTLYALFAGLGVSALALYLLRRNGSPAA